MSRVISTLTLALILTGCAEVHTLENNGTHPRYEVECSGKAVSMNICYKKAASLCPNGYKILNNKVKPHNPYPMGTDLGLTTALVNATPGVVKGINIECN